MVKLNNMNGNLESYPWETLLEVLRSELQEYGGLVGLLVEQQKKILAREPNDLMDLNKSVESQIEMNQKILTNRQRLVTQLAIEAGKNQASTLSEMLNVFPTNSKPMFEGIISEINDLIKFAKTKLNQNQQLLVKMSEVTDQVLRNANPQNRIATYDRKGRVASKGVSVEANV
jgi:flagellar biosynthesis/type III secretory pathway chaperone